MRQIGTIEDKVAAKLFGDFLFSREIENEIDEESESDRWVIWILDDDHLKEAADFLAHFQQNPTDPRFVEGAALGQEKWSEAKKENKEATGKVIDARTQVFGQQGSVTVPFLTFGLAFLSIGTFCIQQFIPKINIVSMFLISNQYPEAAGYFPEVLNGQLWRLITPIFLHFGFIHIVFNMLWLKDLGGLIERFHGLALFSVMVLVMAVGSNIGQYLIGGPGFGGMSGVVYGLLGFVWFRGKFDHSLPYQLPSHIVTIMMIWYFLCLFGMIPNVANAAHGVGLVIGLAFGYGTSGHLRQLFR
jgi:rhomboid protease GlpG